MRLHVPSVRSALRSLGDAAARRPALLVGAVTGVLATIVGMLVTGAIALAAWGLTTGGSPLDGLGLGALAWAAAHGVPVMIAGTELTLVPWGWVVLPVLILMAAGRRAQAAARPRTPIEASALVAAAAVTYGIGVGVAAVLADATGANAPVIRSIMQGMVIAAVVLAVGSPTLRALVPDVARRALATGGIVMGAIVTVAALLTAISLILNLQVAGQAAAALGTGVGGGLALLLLQLGYVPVLIAWAASFVVGAPVALPAGAIASPFLGAPMPAELPAVPLLAAIPAGVPPAAWLLPGVAVAGGVLAGSVLARTARGWRAVLVGSGLGALSAGVLAGMIALLAHGSLGTQRLAGMGPDPLVTAALSAVLAFIGMAPMAFARARRRDVSSTESAPQEPSPSIAVSP